MGVKWLNYSLLEIAHHAFVRFDVKYCVIKRNINIDKCKNLNDLFSVVNGLSLTQYYTTEKTNKPYVRISDLSYSDPISKDNIIYLDENCTINTDKVLQSDDLILSTIGSVGKINRAEGFVGGTFSNNTVVLRLKEKSNSKFYEMLLRCDFVQNIIKGFVSQKLQPNLQDYDLKNLPIPLLSEAIQNKIVKQAQPIEQEISVLKSSKTPHIDIINEVFGQEFGFDWKKFERLKEQKIYSLNLSNSSRSVDCRLGCRFHQPVAKYVMDFMSKHTNKRIKDFCSEPICLGASVSPADYDESGEFKYVAMSSFPNWELNIDDSKSVSNEYANRNLNKTLQKGDIVLARSGEGTIGKVALVTDDNIQAIFADFTQRIRLDNYNQTFAYYYFRSMFFQYLVYKEKKGLGNNTNIFPSQIQEFPIPDYSLDKQQEIVSKIETRINAQKDIDRQIADKRQEISRLIESAIKQV